MGAPIPLEKIWARFVLVLKSEHPFFAVLAMFARWQMREEISISRTEGHTLYMSPEFFAGLKEGQRHSYLLHQLLHLALGHPFRGKEREENLWNLAADIVVNNIIEETLKWSPAPNTGWDKRFKGDSVERVYASLLKEARLQSSTETHNNGVPAPFASSESESKNSSSPSFSDDGSSGEGSGSAESKERPQSDKGAIGQIAVIMRRYDCHADFSIMHGSEEVSSQEYWRGAMIKARQLPLRSLSRGSETSTLTREAELIIGGKLDWRALLWKYAAPASSDYHEFDRRFLYRHLYLETLHAEELAVDIVIDTSGSICDRTLTCFLEELLAVQRCHPGINMRFYYVDVAMNGPYRVPKDLAAFPAPVGAGGTSFATYFNQIAADLSVTDLPAAVVYFTDGFGDFPKSEPSVPVLWVVPEDGEEDRNIPFGTIVRIEV